MTTSNFTTTILVDQPPGEVFDAINNVRGWWTGNPGVEGSTDKLNDEFTYSYEPYHYSKQKITELIPGEKVVWLITDSQLSFVEDKDEWTNTKIVFDITTQGNQTQVKFTHLGLVPGIECYNDCSNAWAGLINNSLRNFIAEGQPAS